MRANRLRELWAADGVAVNGWLQIPHGFATEIMAGVGWDSLTIDMQHGPVDYGQALAMLQALSATEVTPLARVPWNEPGIIMKMLDAGCFGIICPMINTAEQCERFVGACRYPPKGYRSFGPTRVTLYAGVDYALHANDSMIALAMIETAEAVDNLAEILAVPGLDGVYVGPADLAQSLGHRPAADHTDPELLGVIERIRDATRERGLIAGIHVGSVDYGRRMAAGGFQFITIQADGRLLATAAKQAVDLMKGSGEAQARAAGPY
jgi:4-hydroxy-2-oxoheptanedioate aldolase